MPGPPVVVVGSAPQRAGYITPGMPPMPPGTAGHP